MSNVPPYDPYGSPQPPGGGYNPPPPPPPPGGGYSPPPPPPPGGGYNPPPPPPPPGGYNPPPPPPGGYTYPMPPPSGPYMGPSYGGAPGALAEWPMRALGTIIDAVPLIVAGFILVFFRTFGFVLLLLADIGWGIFLAVQFGQIGSTPGMRVVGLKGVSKSTGQPIGAGMGVVRGICHIIDGFFCGIIGFLIVPLVSQEKQTIADMIVGTVVINVPKQPFSLTPRS